MSRNKIYLAVLISMLLAVIFYVYYGMMNIGKEKQHYTVSVIVNNSSSDRWNAFKEGLNQGADDCGIYLNFVSTPDFVSLEEEYAIIDRELESDVDGVIVQPCESADAGEDDPFSAVLEGKPAVMIENISSPYSLYSAVHTNNESLGKAIAQAVAEGETVSEGGLTIGVLGGNQNKLSLQQRLAGFEQEMEGTAAEVSWVITQKGSWDSGALAEKMQENPVDVIVSLDNDETEWAVDYLVENPWISSRLYGVGRSEKTVYYLDKGAVETLIVPNEYFMGYESINILWRELDNSAVPGEETEVDFLTVTKERMYDDDVVKVLFPTIR